MSQQQMTEMLNEKKQHVAVISCARPIVIGAQAIQYLAEVRSYSSYYSLTPCFIFINPCQGFWTKL